MIVIDERGQRHEIATKVFHDLRRQGVVWRERGAWRIFEHDTDLRDRPEIAVCDFCNERPIAWNIQCRDFVMAERFVTEETDGPYHSQGDWAACDACGSLIALRDRAGLLRRSLGAFASFAAQLSLPIVHERFWKHFIKAERIDMTGNKE